MMKRKEKDYYPEISEWFGGYLAEKYKSINVETTYKTSKIALDNYLKSRDLDLVESIGLGIKIDVVGIIRNKKNFQLAFIEVKDKPLTISDLGQLWGYTKLINPVESFLISTESVGSLNYILKVLHREDILSYGLKEERFMRVCRWDSQRKAIDYHTLLPKL